MRRVPPKVIRTEEENEAYSEILYELDRRGTKLTAAEKQLAELLTLLIEDFEERHYRLPRAKPIEVLRFLMEQHQLLQKDLADVFGTPSVVSEVLNGKRQLNREQIARLSAVSGVTGNVFLGREHRGDRRGGSGPVLKVLALLVPLVAILLG